ncbi:MAG: type II toxin-antitoxin system Phd/YefM family antitoxin [Anaerohalosphaeraceae bacterium]|nr:type II toxin-antitoxin system Phd/YefM family antitoxin [Anaerohalosphaeraceae bacterium]
MTTLDMTSVRHDFSEIANRVIFASERVCVRKNGKKAFAFVPIEDLELLEILEDKLDVDAAKVALKRGKFTDIETVAKKLGI